MSTVCSSSVDTARHARWLAALVASSRVADRRRSAREHEAALDRLLDDLGLERPEVVVRGGASPAVLARIEPA